MTEKNESKLKNSYSFQLLSGLLIAKAGESRQGLFVCIYLFKQIYKKILIVLVYGHIYSTLKMTSGSMAHLNIYI